ncbi:MAG TPA: hypothetical protein VMI31_08070, partial [Fimbriimonadaceae bacterium]|nr:hypothetical protein [Fimbriimonadaceae bacterium]
MPTEPAVETPKVNPWLITIGLAVLILLIVWFFESRGSGLKSDVQAEDLMKQAQDLSLRHLQDYDNGAAMSEGDKEDLRKAAALFDSVCEYKPGDIRPWLGAGKIYQALGDDDAAIKRLTQGLADMASVQSPVLADTATEAHYVLSVSLFNKRDYADALKQVDIAIQRLPMASPIYLGQRASIEIQMKPPRIADANHDLAVALKADPTNKRCLSLLKLLTLSDSQTALSAAEKDFAKGDYRSTVTECTSGLKGVSGSVKLLMLRAASNKALGHPDLAIGDLDHVTRILQSQLEGQNYEGVIAASTDALVLAKDYPPFLALRARAFL